MNDQASWEFHCPECGVGHEELGQLGRPHEIYCVVCLEEEGRNVRLHRWEAVLIEQAKAA